MLNLTIELTGVDDAIAELESRFSAAKDAVVEDLKWFGQGAKQEMIDTHTFQNRTFRLEGSIDFDVVHFTTVGPYVVVFALTEYASQVEFGVPGRSRPYPFFWPVWYKWVPLLEERMQASWRHGFGDIA